MQLPDTKCNEIRRETDKEGNGSVSFHVDQFTFYREAMSQYLQRDRHHVPLEKSLILFELPNSRRHGIPTVWVISDGVGMVEVHTHGIVPQDKTSLPEEEVVKFGGFHRLFATDGFDADRAPFRPLVSNKSGALESDMEFGIFATGITPFLNRGGWPPFGERKFLLYLDQSTYLRMGAHVDEDRHKDTLDLTYIPDGRDWNPFNFARLHRQGDLWYFTQPQTKPQKASR